MNFAASSETVPKLGSTVVHYMLDEGIKYTIDLLPTGLKESASIIKGAMESVNAEIKRAEEAASEYEIGTFIRKMRTSVDQIQSMEMLASLSLPTKLYEHYNEIFIQDIEKAKKFLAAMQKERNDEQLKKRIEESIELPRHLEFNMYLRFLEAMYRKSEWNNNEIPYPARTGLIEIKFHVQDGLEYVKVHSPLSKRVAEGLTQTAEKDSDGKIDLNKLKCHKWAQVRNDEWTPPLYYGWILIDDHGREVQKRGLDAWTALGETLHTVDKIDGED